MDESWFYSVGGKSSIFIDDLDPLFHMAQKGTRGAALHKTLTFFPSSERTPTKEESLTLRGVAHGTPVV